LILNNSFTGLSKNLTIHICYLSNSYCLMFLIVTYLFCLQTYVLKYLLFFSDELSNPEVSNPVYALGRRRLYQSSLVAGDDFSSLTDDSKTRYFLVPLINDDVLYSSD
jgi:hypothetical protein